MPTEVVDAEVIADSTGESPEVQETSDCFLLPGNEREDLNRSPNTEPVDLLQEERAEVFGWPLLPFQVDGDMLVRLEAALVSGMGLFLFFLPDSGKLVKGLGYASYVLGLFVLAS